MNKYLLYMDQLFLPWVKLRDQWNLGIQELNTESHLRNQIWWRFYYFCLFWTTNILSSFPNVHSLILDHTHDTTSILHRSKHFEYLSYHGLYLFVISKIRLKLHLLLNTKLQPQEVKILIIIVMLFTFFTSFLS